ncbi:cytochrome P450 [Lentinula detonsa]|uniref:Cytochrome P450 n=1 Tax=Lentinula detonsa TaxID=2804962 RepID=A0AA38PXI6_9AGAR|nr:cytochrome P450 [Lentinula detonsa]
MPFDIQHRVSELSITSTVVILTMIFIFCTWLRHQFGQNKLRPLPPGPRKLPLLGNSLDMPSTHQWLKFSEWADQFNTDILHLKVAGGDYIVLSSYEASTELLDRRSGIYSNRPHITMLQDLVGWDGDVVLLPYGKSLHAHRKLFHQEFHPANSMIHRPHEKKARTIFLNNLIETPEEWLEHIKQMIGTIILAVAYGIRVQSKDDANIVAAEKMTTIFKAAGMPGSFLVDIFPILRYIPSWFPGASFKRKAKSWRGIFQKTITPPFMHVKQAMINGTAEDSFTLRCLQNVKNPDPQANHLSEEEEIIKETAGAMYEAGADTGVTALRTFLLAMMSFPNVQKEAQEELDNVVGKERLPDYEDLDTGLLPFAYAVILECFRWQPVVPLGFPHKLDKEDTYKGYFFPKGSIVASNVWRILRDEKIYGVDTDTFNPKRWLQLRTEKSNDGEQGRSKWILNSNMMKNDPMSISFGFGRRVCPGKHMGLSTFHSTVASLLHCFDIAPPLGEDGIPMVPKIEYISGVLNSPAPFKCSINPRSKEHVAIVQQALMLI